MEKLMPSLAQASKACGFTGTAMLHCGILLACLFMAAQAAPTPLPPPVEAIRITLAEPAAAPAPSPRAVPVSEPPAPVPIVEETPPEAAPPVQDAQAKPKENKPKPRKVQTKPVPARTHLPEKAVDAPSAVAPQPDQALLARTRRAEEARQTLLSALIARLEREKRYPVAARRLGLEGQVMAVVRVDAQGRITSVSANADEAQAVLERATLEALQRVQENWKPTPVPEPMTLRIPVRYSLKNS